MLPIPRAVSLPELQTYLLELLLPWLRLDFHEAFCYLVKPSTAFFPGPFAQKRVSHENRQCQTATQALSQTEIQFLAWNYSKAGYYSLHSPALTDSHVLRHVFSPTEACWPPWTPHLPQERYSQESHRKYLSSHPQTCSPCTSQSQQFWYAPHCPRGRCLASSLCGEREGNPFFKVLKNHTSYFSRLHLLTCYLPLCRAYMLQLQRKLEGQMRSCSLRLWYPSSSFLLSQHWFICWRRIYPRHLLKVTSFEDAE